MTKDPRRLSTVESADPGVEPKAPGASATAGPLPALDRTDIAIVEDISPDGRALIVVNGQTRPREASSLLRFPSAAAAADALLGQTVLVAWPTAARPVIIGLVADRLWDDGDAGAPREARATLDTTAPIAVQADKRHVELEATEEIRLTCGKSLLVMRRDGTVIIRGVNIVNRATQSQKIRGATVSVN